MSRKASPRNKIQRKTRSAWPWTNVRRAELGTARLSSLTTINAQLLHGVTLTSAQQETPPKTAQKRMRSPGVRGPVNNARSYTAPAACNADFNDDPPRAAIKGGGFRPNEPEDSTTRRRWRPPGLITLQSPKASSKGDKTN